MKAVFEAFIIFANVQIQLRKKSFRAFIKSIRLKILKFYTFIEKDFSFILMIKLHFVKLNL